MIEVRHARYLDNYRIEIEFTSGQSGTVDLQESLWGPVFEPLRDIEKFKCFTVSPVLHTIAWDNDADFAPEYLRNKMTEQAMSENN